MKATIVKEQIMKFVESLPDDVSWDDLMYAIYVHQAVEAGLADSDAGRVLDLDKVRARFEIDPCTWTEVQ